MTLSLVLIVLAVLFTAAVIAVAANEFSSYMVYGGFIEENKLREFLFERLQRYSLNPFGSNMLDTGQAEDPFIARTAFWQWSLSKWYIHGMGQIPRWSNASKILDSRLQNLLAERNAQKTV